MGNKPIEQSNQAHTHGQKIVLKLRYRDIILHYSFKMKLTIADIGLFPDHLEGLRLWDSDIVISRFIILENEMFKNKDVMVFRAGVGIAGVTLSKWGGCKTVTMCDIRKEVVENMKRNCLRNATTDVTNILINISEINKFGDTYDRVLATDLFGEGFTSQGIIQIWRKLLRVQGEAIMIIPDKKEESKKLLELIDREQFQINNLILTAEEYEASPLFNKLESESEFPLLGKSTFYAICLKKLKEAKAEENQDKGEVVSEKEGKKVEKKELPSKVNEGEKPKEVVQPFSVKDKEEERKQKVVEPKIEHQQKPEEQQKEEIKPEALEQLSKEEEKEAKGETSSPQEQLQEPKL